MPFPQVLINSRKRTAPPSSIAPDAKKKRIPGTDGTEAPQDPAADDHMYVKLWATLIKDVTNIWMYYRQ